jgi:hypothetical protein
MHSILFSIRKSLVPAAGLITIAVFLAACSKFDNEDTSTVPVAGLMAFNLAPDKAAIGITLSNNNLLNAPLAYTNYTGTYQRIYAGNRAVESFDVITDTTIAGNDFNFETNKYYSLFVAGANGNYTNIISHDNFDSLGSASGKAYIRYINAIPDSTKPTVTITANGNNMFNSPAGFTAVSEYAAADPGQLSIAVKNNTNIDASRTITVEQGKVYTVLLAGIPGATDTTKSVQIKYILNGSLSQGQ